MQTPGYQRSDARSVSAEIEDLEAGTYNVLFKVTAHRSSDARTAVYRITKYAKADQDEKEKLLAVGRRFDYAQSKGGLRAMEEANKKRWRREERALNKHNLRLDRKHNKKERESTRRKKEPINDAMRSKLRAFAKKQRERVTLKERMEAASKAQCSDEHVKEQNAAQPVLTAAIDQTLSRGGTKAEPFAGMERKDSATNAGDSSAGGHCKETNGVAANKEGLEQDAQSNDNGGPSNHGALLEQLSELDLTQSVPNDTRIEETKQANNDNDYEDYDVPIDTVEQLVDDDFEWDSAIDDPVDTSSDEEDMPEIAQASTKNTLFADDPWNAMCVLGLRVYSLNAVAKVSVIKGKDGN